MPSVLSDDLKVRRPMPIRTLRDGVLWDGTFPRNALNTFGPGSFFPVALTWAELMRWYWAWDEWQFAWSFSVNGGMTYDYTNPGDYSPSGSDTPDTDPPCNKRRRLNGRLIAFQKSTDDPTYLAVGFLQIFDLRPSLFTPPDPLLASFYEALVLYDPKPTATVTGKRYYPFFYFRTSMANGPIIDNVHSEGTAQFNDIVAGDDVPWITSGVNLLIANPSSADISLPMYRQNDGRTEETTAIRVKASQYIATV